MCDSFDHKDTIGLWAREQGISIRDGAGIKALIIYSYCKLLRIGNVETIAYLLYF